MKHHKTTVALVGASLAYMVIAFGASAADPDRVAEGRTHFSRGVDYYKDEDYRNAMVEFKRAYELAPNYKLLYNLGQTGQELKDYAFALKSLERYLADGGAEIAADRRAEVSALVRKLKQRVAEVTINTTVSDADVLVDDVPAGRTPLTSPLVVSAGHRKIVLSKGSKSATHTVDIAGGERTELSFDLAQDGPSSLDVPEPAEGKTLPAGRKDTSQSAQDHDGASTPVQSHPVKGSGSTWVGVVVTGVLAVATGVTGGFAIAAKRDYDATIDRYPITPGDVKDARDKTRTLALATDILGGATLLSGGITIWMALSNSPSSSKDAERVGVTLTPTGLVARGRF